TLHVSVSAGRRHAENGVGRSSVLGGRADGQVVVGDSGRGEGFVERGVADRGGGGGVLGVVAEVDEREAVEVGDDEPVTVEQHAFALAHARPADRGDGPSVGGVGVEVDAVEGAVAFADDHQPLVGHRDEAGEVAVRGAVGDFRGDRQGGGGAAAGGDLLWREVPQHRTDPVGGPEIAGVGHHEVDEFAAGSGVETTDLGLGDQVVHADLAGDPAGGVEQAAGERDPFGGLAERAFDIDGDVGVIQSSAVDRAVVVGGDEKAVAGRVPVDVHRL